MLQLVFRIVHNMGSINIKADFLSQLEPNPQLWRRSRSNLGNWTDNTDWVENVLLGRCSWRKFLLETSRHHYGDGRTNPSKKQTISEKLETMSSKRGNFLNGDIIRDFTKVNGKNAQNSNNEIRARARLRVLENFNLLLKKLNWKGSSQPDDEPLSTKDSRYKHHTTNDDRIALQDNLLFWKYYGNTCSVKNCQILKPKPLMTEVLRDLHGDFDKITSKTKTIHANRARKYYQNMAKLIRKWVTSCKQCVRDL